MGTYLQSSSLSYSYQNVIQITTKFTININTNQFSNAKVRFMKHLMKAMIIMITFTVTFSC